VDSQDGILNEAEAARDGDGREEGHYTGGISSIIDDRYRVMALLGRYAAATRLDAT
jgi:hypothetical protein